MRIGFDATVLGEGTRYTGTGQYTARLLEHVSLVAPDDQFIVYVAAGAEGAIPAAPNVELRVLKPLPGGKISALVTHLVKFPRLMNRDRLDVLHVPAVHTRPSLPPVPRFVPCPTVVTLHDLIPITFYGRSGYEMPWRLERYYRWNLGAVARAQQIITVSESSRHEIISNLDVPPERVTAVYNGIDVDAWSSAGSNGANPHHGDRPYILFGGSYEPRKNLRRLLDAFERSTGSGLFHDLVMVVDVASGYAAETRRYASTLNCRDRLHFLSGLDEPALMALYRGADLFVFPSLSEGFGFPPLQAMASGVPVAASDLPVLREVLGDAALFFDPYDPDAIAAAISTGVSDAELARRLIDAGRVQAAGYSWSEAARRTVEIIRSAGAAGP